MNETISRDKAVAAARKRLSFKRDKQIEEHAEWAGLSIADVYKCGAEEAQCEIVSRLRNLPVSAPQKPAKQPRKETLPDEECKKRGDCFCVTQCLRTGASLNRLHD